jgi:hypothetical protein
MSNKVATSTNHKSTGISKGKLSDVSILSLDNLADKQHLIPGQSHTLADGVTLSILQSAAEALLEVDHAAAGRVLVNTKQAGEVSTVQPGQIIRTAAGRFVIVRHMQALIIPKASGQARPTYMKDAITLALASLEQPPLVDEKPTSTISPDKTGQEKRTRLVRIVSGALLVAIIAIYFYGESHPPKDSDNGSIASEQANAKASGEAKSKIILVNPAKEKAGVEGLSTDQSDPKATAEARREPEQKVSDPKPKTNLEPSTARKVPSNPSAPPVTLNERERQTVLEYKLEGRFDRENAIAKLKHFANSFPEGSPARREVERAAKQL